MQAGEIKAKITADGSGFSSEIESAKSEIKEMAQAIVNAMRDIVRAENSAADARRQAAQEAQKAAREAEKAAQQQEAAVKRLALTAGVALAAITKTLKEATTTTVEFRNAMMGLESVAEGVGEDVDAVKKAAQALVADGLMPLSDAATGLKNLLATGFSLDEAIVLMERFKDAAAFGRQGALEFGEAVRTATEGIKNGNSILVDNAGVTKNLSIMLQEAGLKASDLGRIAEDVRVRMAIFNGILRETQHQVGDASKLAEDLGGSLARTGTNVGYLKNALGEAVSGPLTELLDIINPIISGFTDWMEQNEDLVGTLAAVTTAALGLITVTTSLRLLLKTLTSDVVALGGALKFLFVDPIGLAITAIVGLTTAIITYRSWQKRSMEQTIQAGEEAKKKADRLEELKEKYQQLTATLDKTRQGTEAHKKAQAELNTVISEIAKMVPGAVAALGSLSEARIKDMKLIDQQIAKERELWEESKKLAIADITYKLEAARAKLREAEAQAKDWQRSWDLGTIPPVNLFGLLRWAFSSEEGRKKQLMELAGPIRQRLVEAQHEVDTLQAQLDALLGRKQDNKPITGSTTTTTATTTTPASKGPTPYQQALKKWEQQVIDNKAYSDYAKQIELFKEIVGDVTKSTEEAFDYQEKLDNLLIQQGQKRYRMERSRIAALVAQGKMTAEQEIKAIEQILKDAETYYLDYEQKIELQQEIDTKKAQLEQKRLRQREQLEQEIANMQIQAARELEKLEVNKQAIIDGIEKRRQQRLKELEEQYKDIPKSDPEYLKAVQLVNEEFDREIQKVTSEIEENEKNIRWKLGKAEADLLEAHGMVLEANEKRLEVIRDKLSDLRNKHQENTAEYMELLADQAKLIEDIAKYMGSNIIEQIGVTGVERLTQLELLVKQAEMATEFIEFAKQYPTVPLQDLMDIFKKYRGKMEMPFTPEEIFGDRWEKLIEYFKEGEPALFIKVLNDFTNQLKQTGEEFIETWNKAYEEFQLEKEFKGKGEFVFSTERLEAQRKAALAQAEQEIADKEELDRIRNIINEIFDYEIQKMTTEHEQKIKELERRVAVKRAEATGMSLQGLLSQEFRDAWKTYAEELARAEAGEDRRLELLQAQIALMNAEEALVSVMIEDYKKLYNIDKMRLDEKQELLNTLLQELQALESEPIVDEIAGTEQAARFKALSQLVQDITESIPNSIEVLSENIYQSIEGSFTSAIDTISDALESGLNYWESLLLGFGSIITQALKPAISSLTTEMGKMMASSSQSLMSLIATATKAVSAFLAQAYAMLLGVFAWMGPLAPVAAGAVIAAAMVEIGKLGVRVGQSLGLVKPDIPDDDIKKKSGTQISEITGPTRDLLISLLSPLRNLDILPGLFESMRTAIYEMRDAFLGYEIPVSPAPALVAAGGAGNTFVIEYMNVEVPDSVSMRDVDEFMRLMGDRAQVVAKGRGA